MAALTAREIDSIRQALVAELGTADFLKPTINAAIQATEDVLAAPALAAQISAAINAATSPQVLSATQKRLIVRHVLSSRFARGNN